MVRMAVPTIVYQGQDITADVTPYLTVFRFEEYAESNKSDNLTLEFEDTQGLWKSGFFPARGAKVSVDLVTRDWLAPGDSATLKTGKMELDEIRFHGPPSICGVDAVAIGVTSSIRREKKTEAWENVTPRDIAQDIAKRNGFELNYENDNDVVMERFDQRDQTDLEFLGDVCEKSGLCLKAYDGKLRIFKEKIYDRDDVEATIRSRGDGLKSYDFRIISSDTYRACEIKYQHLDRKNLIEYKFDPGKGTWEGGKLPIGQTLKLNCQCSCEAEAQETAIAALRKKNKRQTTGSMTLLGNPRLRAGMVVAFDGFGRFDSDLFLIDSTRHEYSKGGGYQTHIDFRKTLEY